MWEVSCGGRKVPRGRVLKEDGEVLEDSWGIEWDV